MTISLLVTLNLMLKWSDFPFKDKTELKLDWIYIRFPVQ